MLLLMALSAGTGLDLKPVYHFTRAANEMNGPCVQHCNLHPGGLRVD